MNNREKTTGEQRCTGSLVQRLVIFLHVVFLVVGAPIFSVLVGLIESKDYARLATRDFTIGFLAYFVNIWERAKEIVA